MILVPFITIYSIQQHQKSDTHQVDIRLEGDHIQSSGIATFIDCVSTTER